MILIFCAYQFLGKFNILNCWLFRCVVVWKRKTLHEGSSPTQPNQLSFIVEEQASQGSSCIPHNRLLAPKPMVGWIGRIGGIFIGISGRWDNETAVQTSSTTADFTATSPMFFFGSIESVGGSLARDWLIWVVGFFDAGTGAVLKHFSFMTQLPSLFFPASSAMWSCALLVHTSNFRLYKFWMKNLKFKSFLWVTKFFRSFWNCSVPVCNPMQKKINHLNYEAYKCMHSAETGTFASLKIRQLCDLFSPI